jgi:hypothetical protein
MHAETFFVNLQKKSQSVIRANARFLLDEIYTSVMTIVESTWGTLSLYEKPSLHTQE